VGQAVDLPCYDEPEKNSTARYPKKLVVRSDFTGIGSLDLIGGSIMALDIVESFLLSLPLFEKILLKSNRRSNLCSTERRYRFAPIASSTHAF
jgi:hypothetical protein